MTSHGHHALSVRPAVPRVARVRADAVGRVLDDRELVGVSALVDSGAESESSSAPSGLIPSTDNRVQAAPSGSGYRLTCLLPEANMNPLLTSVSVFAVAPGKSYLACFNFLTDEWDIWPDVPVTRTGA